MVKLQDRNMKVKMRRSRKQIKTQFEKTTVWLRGDFNYRFSGNAYSCHQGDGAQLQLANVLHEERCDAQRGHLRVKWKYKQACQRSFYRLKGNFFI